jgi:serine/threonine-protein kinase HipA
MHDETLHVVMGGRHIGQITRASARRLVLRYDPPGDDPFTPLSVTMPDPDKRYRNKLLSNWLRLLLPDREETLSRWRQQFGIQDTDDVFEVLRHVGEDVAGAAQFVVSGRLETVLSPRNGSLTALDERDIAEKLRRALRDVPLSDTEGPQGKFSLAGQQAKIALTRIDGGWGSPEGAIPSTHIIKPAIPKYQDQDLVEMLTMRLARALHIPTARAWIETFDDTRALVVERYDRVKDDRGEWRRIHQEDMCQATGTSHFRKYEIEGGPTAGKVADTIRQYSTEPNSDNRAFAQALIFNWATCGTDAHARNYSLLLHAGQVRLAPLYDLNSFLAYTNGSSVDLAMGVRGIRRAVLVSRAAMVSLADELHVAAEWMQDEIDRQLREIPELLAAEAAKSPEGGTSPVVANFLENTERWIRARSQA